MKKKLDEKSQQKKLLKIKKENLINTKMKCFIISRINGCLLNFAEVFFTASVMLLLVALKTLKLVAFIYNKVLFARKYQR